MRKLSELMKLKMVEMTGEEYAFFNRMTSKQKSPKEEGIVSVAVSGTKGMFRSMANAFTTCAAETKLQDRVAALEEIKQSKADLEKMKTDGDITPKQYNYKLAELEMEEEELSQL